MNLLVRPLSILEEIHLMLFFGEPKGKDANNKRNLVQKTKYFDVILNIC